MAKDINAAYQTLSDSRLRLVELLKHEGEDISSTADQVPDSLADLFMRVAGVFRSVDSVLEETREVSELERALKAEELVESMDALQELSVQLGQIRAILKKDLKVLDKLWIEGKKDFKLIKDLMLRESFLSKWEKQMEEKIFLVGQLL
ncbi:MAG: hypothetical protein AAGA18_02300 [Verrucomicrobiota bacterium]